MKKPILTTRMERAMAEDEEWFTILNNLLADMKEQGLIEHNLLSGFSTAIYKYKTHLKQVFREYGYEEYKERRERVYKNLYKLQHQLSLI